MANEKHRTRRSVLKRAGGALLTIPLVETAAASDESSDTKRKDDQRNDESREVIYADDDARIVKYNDHEYSVEGDLTPEEQTVLMREHVWSNDDEVGTQTHDDSGYKIKSECVDVNGKERGLIAVTDAWAQADNETLRFEGEARATSTYDCTYDRQDSIDKISITTTLGGTYKDYVTHISTDAGYDISYANAEATFDGSRTDESSYSIFHYDGAVVMEAKSCWYDAYQDDVMTFVIDNEQHNLGNYVKHDVGHCF